MTNFNTRLSININKIATLRNARGGDFPDPVKAALYLQNLGVQSITVHPRPDERHIRWSDIEKLKKQLKIELNIEGYPSDFFIDRVIKLKPEQVTLVPDPPEILTSNAGWNTIKEIDFLRKIIKKIKNSETRVSLFVDPDINIIEGAKETGADTVELYTGVYAENYHIKEREQLILPYIKAAELAKTLNLKVHAGHDLNTENLTFLKQKIPFLTEVSIGHAFIADALYEGFEMTLKKYQTCLK